MSYPPINMEQLRRVQAERDAWRTEAIRWSRHHEEVVAAKRKLSAKYGVIMRRKPKARYRRTIKRLKRSVTKLTHKPGRMR